jgi:hypothetical protein
VEVQLLTLCLFLAIINLGVTGALLYIFIRFQSETSQKIKNTLLLVEQIDKKELDPAIFEAATKATVRAKKAVPQHVIKSGGHRGRK